MDSEQNANSLQLFIVASERIFQVKTTAQTNLEEKQSEQLNE